MIIYEINLKIDAAIVKEYDNWLHEHIQKLLTIPGFQGAGLFEEAGEDPSQCLRTVQYRLTDRPSLENYLNLQASGMRKEALERFPGRFSASRRVMELVRDYPDVSN